MGAVGAHFPKVWTKSSCEHFLRVLSHLDHRGGWYDMSVGGGWDFPILPHIKTQDTLMVTVSVKLTQITSNLDSRQISLRGTISVSFMKIRRRDVIWRHMTSFLSFGPKNCWRQQILNRRTPWNVVFRKEHSKTEKMRVNHFQATFRSNVVAILNMSDFWWRHQENDVIMTSQWRHRENFWHQRKIYKLPDYLAKLCPSGAISKHFMGVRVNLPPPPPFSNDRVSTPLQE